MNNLINSFRNSLLFLQIKMMVVFDLFLEKWNFYVVEFYHLLRKDKLFFCKDFIFSLKSYFTLLFMGKKNSFYFSQKEDKLNFNYKKISNFYSGFYTVAGYAGETNNYNHKDTILCRLRYGLIVDVLTILENDYNNNVFDYEIDDSYSFDYKDFRVSVLFKENSFPSTLEDGTKYISKTKSIMITIEKDYGRYLMIDFSLMLDENDNIKGEFMPSLTYYTSNEYKYDFLDFCK